MITYLKRLNGISKLALLGTVVLVFSALLASFDPRDSSYRYAERMHLTTASHSR